MWFVKVNESRQIELNQSDWIPRLHIEHTLTHDNTILTRTFLLIILNYKGFTVNHYNDIRQACDFQISNRTDDIEKDLETHHVSIRY